MRMQTMDASVEKEAIDAARDIKVSARNVDVFYDDMQALHGVSVEIPNRMDTALPNRSFFLMRGDEKDEIFQCDDVRPAGCAKAL